MININESEDLPPKDGAEEQHAARDPASAARAPDTRRLRPRTLGLIAVVALLPLAASLTYGATLYNTRQRDVMQSAAQQREFVPSLRTAAVQPADGDIVVTLPATTLAFAQANIFARANGYIETRKVDIGDRVKAGDLLAQITAPELDHQIAQNESVLNQGQSTLKQQQASRDLARVTNERDSALVKKGWVTPQQGDTDRLTLAAQEAALGVAQSNIAAQQSLIRVLRQQKAYQGVVAPFDGVITQRNVDTGSLVQAGSTYMFTLMQDNVIRVQIYVPQDAAFGIAAGVDAVIRVPENPNRTFPGKVTRFAHALMPGTRTLLTEIDVPNPDGALSPGLYVTAELHIPRKNPSVIVPADAIVFNADGLQVAVAENGVARLRKVTVARDFGTTVEVSDGIKAGDEVILKPPVALADGGKVQTRPDAVQTSAR